MTTYEIGETLHGLFLIVSYISEGASGKVYKALLVAEWKGMKAGTPLALKFYKREIYDKEDKGKAIERRIREAISQSLIRHPNVVKVFDSREFWRPAEDYFFLVMEYLNGVSLDSYIRANGQIAEEEAFSISLSLVLGLFEMHKAKLLHRDLKPANVQLCEDGRPVILDLGVVKPLSEHALTESQMFLGTKRFASPEWLFAEECTESSDVYSLGAVIYSMLHGYDLFSETKLFSRLVLDVKEKTPNIVRERQSIKAALLSDLVSKMLSKVPIKRPGLSEIKNFLEEQHNSRVWRELLDSRSEEVFGIAYGDGKMTSLEQLISLPKIEKTLAHLDYRVYKDTRIVLLLEEGIRNKETFLLEAYKALRPDKRILWVQSVLPSPSSIDINNQFPAAQFRVDLARAIEEIEGDPRVIKAISGYLDRAEEEYSVTHWVFSR